MDAPPPVVRDGTMAGRPVRVLHYNLLFSAAWDPDADGRFRFDADARELYFCHVMKKYRQDDWRAAFGDLPPPPPELRTSEGEELERRLAERRGDTRRSGDANQNSAFYYEGLPWEQDLPVYLMRKLARSDANPDGLDYRARDEARLWRRLDEALEEHDPRGDRGLRGLWERRWSDAVVAGDPRVAALRTGMQRFIDLFASGRRLGVIEAKLGREIGQCERDGVPLVACLTEVARSWALRLRRFFDGHGFASHFEAGSVSKSEYMGTLIAYPREALRVLSRQSGAGVLQALDLKNPSRDRIRAYLEELEASAAGGEPEVVRDGDASVTLHPTIPFPYAAEEAEQIFDCALEVHNRKSYVLFHFEFVDPEDPERERNCTREGRAEKASRSFVLAPYHMPQQVHYRVPSSGKHAGRMVMGLHAHGIARLVKRFADSTGTGMGEDVPVVLIGDWNIVSDSPLFGLMEGDCLRMRARADPVLKKLVPKRAGNVQAHPVDGNTPMAVEDCMTCLAPLIDLFFDEGRGLRGAGSGKRAALCAATDAQALDLRSVYHRWFAREAPATERDAENAIGFVTTRTQEFCAALDHTFVSGAVRIGAVRKMRTEGQMAESGHWNPDFEDEPSDHQMQVQVLRL